MKKLGENLAALVKVKTIVTVTVLVLFSVLSLRGDIKPDNVVTIAVSVIGFYFGSQSEKKGGVQA